MIEKEYAIALFELSHNLEEIKEEYSVFISFFNDLKNVMASPKINIEEKKKIIDNSFKGFSELFLHFLYVLIDNKRFIMADKIFDEFMDLYCNKNNIAIVEAFVVKKMNSKEKEALIEFLRKKLAKRIELKETIDEKIIGGIKIVYNGNCIDYSASDRLNKMHAWL